MERDIFKCKHCGALLTMSDSYITGRCFECGRIIKRGEDEKMGRDNFSPYVGMDKILKSRVD